MLENVYHKVGVNDLGLGKRIMKFISDRSVVKKCGQGQITLECPDLWNMNQAEFEVIFGVKVDEEF